MLIRLDVAGQGQGASGSGQTTLHYHHNYFREVSFNTPMKGDEHSYCETDKSLKIQNKY